MKVVKLRRCFGFCALCAWALQACPVARSLPLNNFTFVCRANYEQDDGASRNPAAFLIPGFRPAEETEKARPFALADKAAQEQIDAGNLNSAAAICREALEKSRQIGGTIADFSLELTLADVLLRQGRVTESLKIYLRHAGAGISISPVEANICIAYCKLRDRENAARWLQEVERANAYLFEDSRTGKGAVPEDWPETRTLGGIEATCHIILGLAASCPVQGRALSEFVAATKLAPRSGLAVYHLARVQDGLGMETEAKANYRRAATLAHGYTASCAARAVETLDYRSKQRARAAQGNRTP